MRSQKDSGGKRKGPSVLLFSNKLGLRIPRQFEKIRKSKKANLGEDP